MKNIQLVMFIALLNISCNPNKNYQIINGSAMGTNYQIKFNNTSNKSISKSSIDSIFQILNDQMSTYDPKSEISLFNKSENNLKISNEFQHVINKSKYWTKITSGAFDITVFPLLSIWGFGPFGSGKITKIPERNLIQGKLSLIGSDNITMDDNILIKYNENVQIDVNAIAKGYGVDLVFEFLERYNIKDIMVELGGEIRAKGKNKFGKIWSYGIETPSLNSRNQNSYDYIIELNNQSIATSGDYRQFSMINKKIYSHTIDPRNGYPSINNAASVTVLSPKCIDADALSTSLMILDISKGIELIESMDDVEALIIFRDKTSYKTIKSSGMKIKTYKNN